MDFVSWTFGDRGHDQSKPLYIDPSNPTRCISIAQSRTLTRQLVSGLRKNGLETGDCVCVMSFNDIHYSTLMQGIIGSGGIFSGVNPGYTKHELIHHIKITGAKFLLVGLKLMEMAREAAETCGIPKSNVYILNFLGESIPEGQQSWSKLLEHGEADWVTVEDPENTTAAYFTTSGTSGLPKAAMITHSFLNHQGDVQATQALVPYKLLTLITLPPFHAFTLPLQHIMPYVTNTPCYVLSRFDQQKFVQAVHEFGISQTAVVPPVMVEMAKCEEVGKLASLRRVYSAGSNTPNVLQQQLYAKLAPGARIEQGYGMTECGWVTGWQGKHNDATGSIGQPFLGFQLRLKDKDGNHISADFVTGEIEIYNPHPMKGYLDNLASTAETMTADGWIRTGDIGYVDNGNWYVVDRTKDLIKVRGWQVSPTEIEAALREHPEVFDAGVVGMQAADGSGEVPIAFVVPKRSENKLHQNHIKEFLATRLAKYKKVDEVHFIERIPRNASGKILRRVLKESMMNVRSKSEDQVAVANAYSNNAMRDLELGQKRGMSSIVIEVAGNERAGTTKGKSVVAVADQDWSFPKMTVFFVKKTVNYAYMKMYRLYRAIFG